MVDRIICDSFETVKELEGRTTEPGSWHTLSQEDITTFADVTGDRQWIHTDPERAAAGPFGSTIAHGYFVLSLLPAVLSELVDLLSFTAAINYGLNKVRFPHPVPSGSRLRGTLTFGAAEETPRGILLPMTVTLELEGVSKPALVAETVTLLA